MFASIRLEILKAQSDPNFQHVDKLYRGYLFHPMAEPYFGWVITSPAGTFMLSLHLGLL